MEDLLDESGCQKLVHFLPDGSMLLLDKSVQALLHWFGAGLDVHGVLGDLPPYAQHVRGIPHKHVSVDTEEVDEHCFLFGVEAGVAPECLAVRGVRFQ